MSDLPPTATMAPSLQGGPLAAAMAALEAPAERTRRWILVAVNGIVVTMTAAAVVPQLVAGELNLPLRDGVVYPLTLLAHSVSFVYNGLVNLGKVQARQKPDGITRVASMVTLWLLCLAIVHITTNPAVSLLLDQTLSIVTILITGVVIDRKFGLLWMLVTLGSLFLVAGRIDPGFMYAFGGTWGDGYSFEPKPLNSLVQISFVFTLLMGLVTWFQAGLLDKVLDALPPAMANIEKAQLEYAELVHKNARMSAELDVAKRIQQLVLPLRTELTAFPDLQIAARMVPADEVGGDIYDVLPLPDGSTCLVIGDVTDHGLISGVVMLMSQAALRASLEQSEFDLAGSIQRLNSIIYQNVHHRMDELHNLTLSVLHYDDGKVRIAGTHETVILLRADGSVEEIDTYELGSWVGIEPDITHLLAERTFSLNPGDTMLLYTDGVTEAVGPGDEEYGPDRLMATLQEVSELGPDDMLDELFDSVYEWIGDGTIHDDISMMVVKREARPASAASPAAARGA